MRRVQVVTTYGMASLVVLISASILGPASVQNWIREFGAVIAACLAGLITAIYVVITEDQRRLTEKMLRLQFGAGAPGPVVEIKTVPRTRPPQLRVPEAYQYPAEYTRSALPHAATERTSPSDDEIERETEYEMLLITNRSKNEIFRIELNLHLCHGAVKRDFRFEYPNTVGPGELVEIGVWPIENMPCYSLTVQTQYTDTVGIYKVPPVEVKR